MISAGRADVFAGLILPHGLLELTIIFVAAGAGLRLGWSWIAPGKRTRSQALATEGRAVGALALGLAVWLLLSGLVEAFVTPSTLPAWVRVLIGGLVWLAFLTYVFTLGRRAARSGATGDVEEELEAFRYPTEASLNHRCAMGAVVSHPRVEDVRIGGLEALVSHPRVDDVRVGRLAVGAPWRWHRRRAQVLRCIHGARPANLDPGRRVERLRTDRLLRRAGEVPNPLPSPAATEAEATTTAPDTASPSASDPTGGTASPGTGSPGTTSTDTASPATPGTTPSATVLPATCTSVTPVRVARVDTDPRRTTEVVDRGLRRPEPDLGDPRAERLPDARPDQPGPDGGDRRRHHPARSPH